ncbi:hypothetical protein ACFYQ5_08950 [Streptomyces sp. NPDC005794]|uniref:hypothetical protein n=1 Tax=Streptomyces sp. NPDC005794 TaxID=3364733 RepID=UPI00368D147A
MTGNAKIGVALVGGYLLGRTKKAKLAIGFGMFLAGKKLSLDPKQLGRMLTDSPILGTLNDQVRNELVGATKTAATNALTDRATGLADSLRKRTLELDDPSGGRAEEPQDEDTAHEDADEKPAERRAAGAKKASRPAGGARKKAAPAARKATSGARRTASSGARKGRGAS